MMFKVCHVTSAHPSFDTRIFHKECKTLSDAGYRVVLIAQHDRDEIVDGILIRAIKPPQNRLERMTWTIVCAFIAALREKADLYHLHDPELLLMGLFLKLLGKRVIYDIHEDYPDAIQNREWIPSALRLTLGKGMKGMERLARVSFDALIPATPHIARRFPGRKTELVQNLPILNELTSGFGDSYIERPARIAYIGCISSIRGAKEMVRAMEALPEFIGAELVLVGEFSPIELEEELKTMPGWKRTKYLGWKSQRQVIELLKESRIGLVLFHRVPNHIQSRPNKLFEYLSAGIPFVASDFPLWIDLLGESKCGLFVNPLDHESIAKAIRWLLENSQEAEAMGKRGYRIFAERFNWSGEARKLLVVYERILR